MLLFLLVCVCVCSHACTHVYRYVCVHACMCVYMHTCVCMRVCVPAFHEQKCNGPNPDLCSFAWFSVDLYALYKAAKRLGGYSKVRWIEISLFGSDPFDMGIHLYGHLLKVGIAQSMGHPKHRSSKAWVTQSIGHPKHGSPKVWVTQSIGHPKHGSPRLCLPKYGSHSACHPKHGSLRA